MKHVLDYLKSEDAQILTPDSFAGGKEEFEVAILVLHLLVEAYEQGVRDMTTGDLCKILGAPEDIVPAECWKEIIEVNPEFIQVAKLTVDRYNNTLH